MFDLRDKLDRVVQDFVAKVQLSSDKKFFEQLCTYDAICQKLKELMTQKLTGKKIAIYGNGNLTREFFYALGNTVISVSCIIDKDSTEAAFWKLEEVPIITPEEIRDYPIDVVLIPSKVYETEMVEELRRVEYSGEVIGIHSWLRSNGCFIEREFYHYKDLWKYKKVSEKYIDFLQCENRENMLLLISGLLLIRDYGHALTYIEKYIKNGWDDGAGLILKRNIENIFFKVKEEIKNRNTKHVMFYVIDSLVYSEVDNMPHLKRIESENFSFHMLLNQYGTTRESVMTLLTGYQIYEQKLYERKYFTKKDGELLPFLNQECYQFDFIMEKRDYAFAKIDEAKEICNSKLATEVLFQGLCELLRSNQNSFIYMHSLAEIHPPFWNPLFDGKLYTTLSGCDFNVFMKQYRSSQKYVDEVLWFYYKLLKEKNITQIFMGDHGINLRKSYLELFNSDGGKFDIARWDDSLIHPACIISNNKLGVGKNIHLVCNYHFPKIIKAVLAEKITKQDLEDYRDPYLKMEVIPVYNKKSIDHLIRTGNWKWILGVTGFLTENEIYVRFENGEEEYFIDGKKADLKNKVILCRSLTIKQLLEDGNELQNILKLKRFDYHKKMVNDKAILRELV